MSLAETRDVVGVVGIQVNNCGVGTNQVRAETVDKKLSGKAWCPVGSEIQVVNGTCQQTDCSDHQYHKKRLLHIPFSQS